MVFVSMSYFFIYVMGSLYVLLFLSLVDLLQAPYCESVMSTGCFIPSLLVFVLFCFLATLEFICIQTK